MVPINESLKTASLAEQAKNASEHSDGKNVLSVMREWLAEAVRVLSMPVNRLLRLIREDCRNVLSHPKRVSIARLSVEELGARILPSGTAIEAIRMDSLRDDKPAITLTNQFQEILVTDYPVNVRLDGERIILQAPQFQDGHTPDLDVGTSSNVAQDLLAFNPSSVTSSSRLPGAKALTSSTDGNVYLVTPDGTLHGKIYSPDGKTDLYIPIAQVGQAAYNDPTLLTAARQETDPATITRSGSEIILTPSQSFEGSFSAGVISFAPPTKPLRFFLNFDVDRADAPDEPPAEETPPQEPVDPPPVEEPAPEPELTLPPVEDNESELAGPVTVTITSLRDAHGTVELSETNVSMLGFDFPVTMRREASGTIILEAPQFQDGHRPEIIADDSLSAIAEQFQFDPSSLRDASFRPGARVMTSTVDGLDYGITPDGTFWGQLYHPFNPSNQFVELAKLDPIVYTQTASLFYPDDTAANIAMTRVGNQIRLTPDAEYRGDAIIGVWAFADPTKPMRMLLQMKIEGALPESPSEEELEVYRISDNQDQILSEPWSGIAPVMGTNSEDIVASFQARSETLEARIAELDGIATESNQRLSQYRQQIAGMNASDSQYQHLLTSIAYEEDVQQRYQATTEDRDVMHRETIPYDRMQVSIERVNKDEVRIAIDFATKQDMAFLEIRGGEGQWLETPSGTQSQRVILSRARDPNYGNTSPLEVRLRTGADASHLSLVQTVFVSYNQDAGTAQVITPHPTLGALESGRLLEHPITPEVSVVSVQGPNVLVHMQSPHDGSIVQFATGQGMMSSEHVEHQGGANDQFVLLSINGDAPTGFYEVQLRDTTTDMVRSSAMLYWNRDTKTLSIPQDTPVWSPTDYADALSDAPEQAASGDIAADLSHAINTAALTILAENATAQLAELQNQVTSIHLDDAGLRRIQQLNLYRNSTLFVEPGYLEEQLRLRNPSLTGHQWSDTLNANIANLGDYEAIVGDLLGAAVDIFIQIRQGNAEGPLVDQLKTQRDTYAVAPKIRELAAMTGIELPSANRIIEEARAIFSDENDLRQLAYFQGEQAEIEADAQEMVRRHIEWLRVDAIEDSELLKYDPTLPTVSYEQGLANMKIFQSYMQNVTPETRLAAQESAAEAIYVAMHPVVAGLSEEDLQEVSDEIAQQMVEDIGGSAEISENFWTLMRKVMRSVTPAEQLHDLQSMASFKAIGPTQIIDGQTIHLDSEVGLIIAGIFPVLQRFSIAPTSLALLCVRMESVFGIDAKSFYAVARLPNEEESADRFIKLLASQGYDVAKSLGSDLPGHLEYRGDIVRVHFNIPEGRVVQDVSVNAVQSNANAVTVEHSYWQSGQFYADIASEDLLEIGSSSLELTLTFKEGGIQISRSGVVDTAQLQVGPAHADPAIDTKYLDETSPNTLEERNVLNQMLFPLEGNDWTYIIASSFHKDDGLFALDLDTQGIEERVIHAPLGGKVTEIDLRKGRVTIEGSLNGTNWNATFYHLTHILEDIAGMPYEAAGEAIDRLGLKSKYAEQMKAANGGTMPALTSDVLKILEGIPAAKAELQSVLDRIEVVQDELNRKIAESFYVQSWDALGKGGNEGQSTGSHVHMQITVNSKPVNLFAWADAYQPGIQAQVSFEGKGNITMHYDSAIGALVHGGESIVLQRTQEGDEGVNYAYAWEAGVDLEKMERVHWVKVDEIDLGNGKREAVMRWVKFGTTNWSEGKNVWDPTTRLWVDYQ